MKLNLARPSKVDFVAAVRCLSDTNWPGWGVFAAPKLTATALCGETGSKQNALKTLLPDT